MTSGSGSNSGVRDRLDGRDSRRRGKRKKRDDGKQEEEVFVDDGAGCTTEKCEKMEGK